MCVQSCLGISTLGVTMWSLEKPQEFDDCHKTGEAQIFFSKLQKLMTQILFSDETFLILVTSSLE